MTSYQYVTSHLELFFLRERHYKIFHENAPHCLHLCARMHPFSVSWERLDGLRGNLDVVRDQLARQLTQANGGVHLDVRTRVPIFRIT